jgi:hypothetical protein
MQIELGNILEPIASLCSSKDDRAWSGLLKVHLKHPNIDEKQLLCGLRMFALELEGQLTIAKAAKGYDSPALQGELSVKIKGETLIDHEAGAMLVQIVKDSFRKGFEYEIMQVNKNTKEDHAYVITTSPEQLEKILKFQISINNQILTPSVTAKRLTAKEVSKKNCLVIIGKNLNLSQSASDVTRCIQELFGDKLVVDTYFSKAQGELHNGTVNIEVLNPMGYKKFVKTTVKIGKKHVKLTAHPRSLDGSNAPDETLLKEFGFLDVNNAIANAVVMLTNTPTAKGKEVVTRGDLETFVKDALADNKSSNLALMKQEIRAEVRKDIRGELQDFKQEIVTTTQTYTDSLTEKLKLELDSQFETMMRTLNNTRKMLNGDTPTRGALPPPRDSPN